MTNFGVGNASDQPLGPPSAGVGDLPILRGGGLGSPPPQPHRCADTASLILRALEGVPNPGVIDAVRSSLVQCPPCCDAFEVEIRFKIVMAQRTTEKAPPSLQLRISETLRRVDLGDIDVSDL